MSRWVGKRSRNEDVVGLRVCARGMSMELADDLASKQSSSNIIYPPREASQGSLGWSENEKLWERAELWGSAVDNNNQRSTETRREAGREANGQKMG